MKFYLSKLELFGVGKFKILKSLLYKLFRILMLKITLKPVLVLGFRHFLGLIPNNSIINAWELV